MVSAVVMAGYRKEEVEDYKHQLELGYKEEEFVEGYKPLKLLLGKPLIKYTLEKLENIASVDDIVIVGEKDLLEREIGEWLQRNPKPFKIVDQNDEIDDELVDALNIDRNNMPNNSFCGNAVKAYAVTDAYERRDPALFMVSDSPLTKEEGIEYFIENAQKQNPKSSLVYPIASMVELPFWRKAFHRKYFFLINDTKYKYRGSFKTWFTKREGFRISAMAYANPFNIDVNEVNRMYGMRKALSKEVRERICEFLEKFKLGPLVEKYFITKDLRISEVEQAIGTVLCTNGTKCTIMPITDVGSSYDYDSTKNELKVLERMMH